MATLFDENRFEAEIDSKVKTIVKNELPKESVHRATVLRKDSSGIWWVRLDNGDETPVLVNKVDMSVGDVVTVTLRDHVTYADGNITSPPLSASNTKQYVGDVVAHSVQALTADIGYLKADVATIGYAQIEDADITNARIQNLVYEVTQNITHLNAIDANIVDLQTNSLTANSAVITNLQAETAKIENLEAEDLSAAVGYIGELTAGSIDAQDIIADHAEVTNLDANYAHITNGVIDNASIGYADVDDLNAHYAEIDLANIANGTIKTAMIGDAQITQAKIGSAAVGTAQIQNAAITTALIADEAVVDAKILGVSANKLTAGTIDAGKINVANLNAKNLIVEKINGQPVLGGLELVSSSSTGYSSKNPVTEGWYEMVNGSFVLSSDTTVDASKAYYRSGTSTALYDQAYIDSLEIGLNDRIDGAIETFTASAVPTLVNYPASDWSSSDYASHVGDVCYVLNPASQADGYCYRFAYDSTTQTYGWVLIKDSDVTAALQRLVDAEGDIDGLETFQSTTETWMTNTDTEIGSLQTAQTSLSTRLSTAEGTLLTKVDTTTFNQVSDTVDSHTQTIQSMSTTVTTASQNASTALQTALDGAFLVITSTNGQLFKNGSESTILQVAVFPNGGDRCDTLTAVRQRFGPNAYIEWQWKHDTDNSWGTLLSSDSHISHDGMWLTVTPADVEAKTSFSASLVVPDQEEE